MRVGLDVDGVLADFVWGFTYKAQQTQKYYELEANGDMKIFPFNTSEHKEWKFPWLDEFYGRVWGEIKQSQNWWMTLEPLINQEEVNAINYLIRNHDVYFITSRRRTKGLTAEAQTKYWLNGIGIITDYATVIATKRGTKGLICKALDIEYYLDDRVGDLTDIIRDSPDTIVALRKWQYNNDWVFADGANYFSSVNEYIDWLNEINRLTWVRGSDNSVDANSGQDMARPL